MKKRCIQKCCDFIQKYIKCDELKIKKLKYGLEALYNLFTKIIVMLILSIIFGIWKEYILLIFTYALVRRYAYGIHAKKSIICWVTTLPIYLLGSCFIKYGSISNYLLYGIWCFSFVSFILWAPADTPALPLIHLEKRKVQKIKSCTVCVAYLAFIIFFQNSTLNKAFIYSLLVQSICINPITYKLTNTPFNNYKVYYAKHGLNY